jgi:hypothetical protein
MGEHHRRDAGMFLNGGSTCRRTLLTYDINQSVLQYVYDYGIT